MVRGTENFVAIAGRRYNRYHDSSHSDHYYRFPPLDLASRGVFYGIQEFWSKQLYLLIVLPWEEYKHMRGIQNIVCTPLMVLWKSYNESKKNYF